MDNDYQHGKETTERWMLSHLRYEFLRTLNPRQFKELWEKCLKGGVRFDDEVDQMRREREEIEKTYKIAQKFKDGGETEEDREWVRKKTESFLKKERDASDQYQAP